MNRLMRLLIALLAFAPLGAFAQISGGTGLSGGPIFLNITGSTQCLHANTNGVISGTGSDCAGGAATGANPTGTVGLSTVNGSAATFLRSDGAPPLSQAITPTWTGAHIFTSAAPQLTLGVNTTTLGALKMFGNTSGDLTINPAAVAGTASKLTFPAGITDFSATGGASQVVKQTSAGGAFTVGQLANTDITGFGTMSTQNASGVAITGGTLAGLTGLAIRDTSAAFDVTLAGTSSTALTAGRTLTLDMKNVAHTLAFNATANTITFPNTASYTLIGSGDTATVTNTMLATAATNTVKGNATSGSASPTDLAVGTCSTSASALNWTTNTGFGCNTAIQAATAGASFVINSNATLTAPGSAQLQLGAANAASPVNQSVLTQGSRGGTDTDVAGANLTIQSGLGTGQAAGSTITMQVPKAGSTGTTAETAVNGLVLGPTAISIGNATSNPTATFLGSGTVAVTGLLQPNAGITATGAAANLNASSNFAVNIGTGTSTGTVTIGQNSATPGAVAINGPLTFNPGTNGTGANWGNTSPLWNIAASTLNDTTASGTVAADAAFSIQAPNFTSTGGASTTITNANVLFIPAPTCSGGVVCTNLNSIATSGRLSFTGGGTINGALNLNVSQNNVTNINSGTTTSAVTIGGGSDGVIINSNQSGSIKDTALISTGTKFTLGSGTGSCGTTGTLVGGAAAGSFICTGTAGAGTITITINGATGLTAPNGWACTGSDSTSGTVWVQHGAVSATTCILGGTTAANTDVITFIAVGY